MFKKTLTYIGLFLLMTLVSISALVTHEWLAEKPFFFRTFLERSVIQLALDSPETLTSLGFLESVGIKSHNAELDDDRPEKLDELFAELDTIHETLLTYEDANLDENQLLSKEIALYLLNFYFKSKSYRYHDYPVNQLFGVQNGFPSFMEAQHKIETLEDAENYLARLKKVKLKFEQNLLGLEIREQQGIIPPRFVIDRVLTEMTHFVATPINHNILYTSLQTKLAEAQAIPIKEQANILMLARQHIQQYVYPAYGLFIDYFSELAHKAGEDDGLWHLPNGDEAYQFSLQFYTTTDYSADEIHHMGLAEVNRIQAEILTILQTQGVDIKDGFSAAIEKVAADPRFYYEDSPAIDGSRPGRFFANLYDIKATPKYSMRTLAYHEGIPGHHFQIAVAMELENMPFFRKMAPFTAYIEGWALYSERVAWELGFQQDPFDNIGRLQAELFRSVRLVVDTGIHEKRWTREQAIDYMKLNTGMAESDVVSEIERYIVMPGQATSYKVGMMKILALRAKARVALDDRFNLKDFHDVILMNGPVPLDILERLVDKYITQMSVTKNRV